MWKDDDSQAGVVVSLCYKSEQYGVPAGFKRLQRWDKLGKRFVDVEPYESDTGTGLIYVPVEYRPSEHKPMDLPSAKALAEQRARKKAAQEAEELKRRADSIEYAQALWKKAQADAGDDGTTVGTTPACLDGRGEDHPRVRAYLAARGIPVDRFEGGRVPPTIRYMGSHLRKVDGDDGVVRSEYIPAIFAAVWGRGKRVVGLQRIYLDPEGGAKKASEENGAVAKKTVGSPGSGQACKLTRQDQERGLLIIAEGVETALGVAAAVGGAYGGGRGPAVWSVISTGGMSGLELFEEDVLPSAGGWVKHLVIAADLDKPAEKGTKRGTRPGTEAAAACALRIRTRWPEVKVTIVHPDHKAAPDLVSEAGLPVDEFCHQLEGAGKGVLGVDWLDVLARYGWEAVRDGLIPTGLEERRAKVLGPTRSERARVVLADLFAPPAPRKDACWLLRRFAGQWWVWMAGKKPRWVSVVDEDLAALTGLKLDEYEVGKRGGLKPAALSGGAVNDVLSAAVVYTAVKGELMPQLLRPDFHEDGKPTWAPAVRFRDDEEGATGDLVAFPMGMLSVDAWVAGRVHVRPSTPRWFSRSCLPFDVDRGVLEALVGEGVGAAEEDAIVAPLCPLWLEFLARTFKGSTACVRELQKWFGYVLTSWIKYHTILWLQGFPRSGKGVIREVMTIVVGEENVGMTDLHSMGERFGMASLVGRTLIFMPELHVGYRTDTGRALEMLKKASGGDPIQVEDKFEKMRPLVRLVGKWAITPNEEPSLPDASAALLERLLVIPTGDPVPVGKRDPRLIDKLRTEGPGIMAWALVGLRRLELDGGFVQPMEGEEIREGVRRSMSPVMAWAQDECVQGDGNVVTSEVLFKCWCQWAKANNREEGSPELLGRRIRAALPGVKHKQRRVGGGERESVYNGIRPRLEVDGDDPVPGVIRDWPLPTGMGTLAFRRAAGVAPSPPRDEKPDDPPCPI